LKRFEAISYAQTTARNYSLAARRELARLPESPAAATLRRLTEFVVDRSV
jgi:geranylgeranyl pyrophosphate synthase